MSISSPLRWLREALGLAFAMLLGGLAVYAAVILKAGEWSNLPHALGGSGSYLEHGRSWALGEGPLSNSRPPVYGFLLGLCFRLASPDNALKWIAGFHVALSFALLLAWYGVVRSRSRSVLAGCVAVLLIAANLSMLREFVTGRETLIFSSIIFAEFALFSMAPPFGSGRASLLGLLSGLAWLTRPTGIVLVVASAALLVGTAWKTSRPRALQILVVFALGLAAPLALWMGYQLKSGQAPTISGRSSTTNLYLGNNEAFAAVYPLLDIEVFNARVAEEVSVWREEGKSPEAEMLRGTLHFFREHPLDALRLAAVKALAFLTPRHFPRGSGRLVQIDGAWTIEDYEPAPPLHDLLTFAALPGVLLLGLALTRWKTMPLEVHFTCAVVMLALALHILTFAETRFRQGFDPALAASGVLTAMHLLRSRMTQRPAGGIPEAAPATRIPTN